MVGHEVFTSTNSISIFHARDKLNIKGREGQLEDVLIRESPTCSAGRKGWRELNCVWG